MSLMLKEKSLLTSCGSQHPFILLNGATDSFGCAVCLNNNALFPYDLNS